MNSNVVVVGEINRQYMFYLHMKLAMFDKLRKSFKSILRMVVSKNLAFPMVSFLGVPGGLWGAVGAMFANRPSRHHK